MHGVTEPVVHRLALELDNESDDDEDIDTDLPDFCVGKG